MKIGNFTALAIILPFISCGHGEDVAADVATEERFQESIRQRAATVDAVSFDLDLIQRTCALYVAISSGTFKTPAAFDREIDGSMIRWNMCDDGTMVACAKVPAANGDTLKVGIPWPYDVVPRL